MSFFTLMAIGSTGDIVETLARPTAPAFTVKGTATPGQYKIASTAIPASWGDLSTSGDGLGANGKLEWHNIVDGWQTHSEPAAIDEIEVTLPLSIRGTAVITMRGVSASLNNGVTTQVAEQTVTHLGEEVTHDAEPVTIFVAQS